MSDQDRGAGFTGMEEVGFPMSGLASLLDMSGPLVDGDTVFDVGEVCVCATPPSAAGLAARQITPPGIIFGSPDLAIDEPIDGFAADDRASLFMRQASGHLFGRPSHSKTVQHGLLQFRLARQPASAPAAGPGLPSA